MRRTALITALLTMTVAAPALAIDNVTVTRKDAEHVEVQWNDSDPVAISLSDTPGPAPDAKAIVAASKKGSATLASPADKRLYVILRDGGDGSVVVAAERELPLQRGSNFRDLGGYVGAGGKTVRWGKIYRSGALPVLTEQDYALLGGLGIHAIVDLRSLEEREVAADQLDDRTGALFISNDYAMKPMMANFAAKNGEYLYGGTEKLLQPQLRAIFNRLLADDGAVMYHCSAGQDRTGIATALVLSALGVDRATIVKDYHLSTALRRPQNELPPLKAEDYPNNPIVQYYAAAAAKPGGIKAEPLYSKSGVSNIVQFFEVLDRDYGGIDAYLKTQLGIGPVEIARLRSLYLN